MPRRLAVPLALACLAAALPASADVVAGEATRYVVGFHALPPDLTLGGSWNGGTVYHLNAPLKAAGVASPDPWFKTRAQADANVRYVDVERTFDLLHIPNDPLFPSQHGAQQVRLPDAWNVTLGKGSVEVCFIDSGFRATHEDLAATRYARGWDFVENDSDPQDERGHGTFVAGIAIAATDNGAGIAGAARVRWAMAKVFGAEGGAAETRVADAITWCADHAKGNVIISMSLGGDAASREMQDAVAYAHAKGHLLVAAAGNGGPCEDCVLYPARYKEVVAVGCNDRNQRLCAFSALGPHVELSAPGLDVLSACFEGDASYCVKSGTSASVPFVSGIAALQWSRSPSLTNEALRARLRETARDLGDGGRDEAFGAGRVDAKCLLEGLVPCGPPPNDAFASAERVRALPLGKAVTTRLATTEPGEPQPCAPVGATVWYAWTAPGSGRATVDTMGSGFDTVLAVHTGASLGTLVPLACSDDADGGRESRVAFDATVGVTYLVQVGGRDGASGDLRLQASCDGCPANNDFARATPIRAVPHGSAQSTRGATVEPGEPLPCGLMGATVWHRFVAPGAGTVTLDTFNSGFDTALAVYTGTSPATLTLLACGDDAHGTPQSQVLFEAKPGVTYHVQVGGRAGASGVMQLNLQCPACTLVPANDAFDAAKVVLSPGYNDRVGTLRATREAGEPQPCGHVGATVWYRVQPIANAQAYIDTYGSDYDTVLAAYEGDRLDDLALLACNDDIAAGAERRSQVVVDLLAGRTYHVQAGGFDGQTGNLQVNLLCVTDCLPGAGNDMRRDAVRIPSLPYGTTQSTLWFTEEPGEPLTPLVVGATAWYRYDAPVDAAPRAVTVDTATSDFNTVLAVYVDGTFVPLGVNDDTDGLGRQSRVTFTAAPGVSYMLQAGGRVNVWAPMGVLAVHAE